MSPLTVSETENQVRLHWLGLHVAFAKDAGLPATWRDVVAAPSSKTAIYEWMAAFGRLETPGEPLPGDRLALVADAGREPLFAH
ncbi:hypothetical protein JYK14_19715 [Siccirubricoccus sp. KC 17139]|uniref:Uncharacterized protein n=1 Tax=Siccirubricoccus soli TaxID=2899147 RepID=A0ABT1DAV8_9PROT|nr:hypothetical protein [Siccirubricoccus soli]MCO6418375.1 hypothetical protein [Siccirubricoccus soli]MCP2684510.1 hypothetical protein [Siccirubricoccus soli]